MRRKFWMVLLALGAVGGFAAGFAQLHHYRHHGGGCAWHGGRAEFESHVADVCLRAADRRLREKPAQ
jgi:hypothetical protein